MGKTGKRFQETRMEQGYTLSDVANALNIEVRYLYDLEDEDYDDLPGKTHVLGYAQQYAHFLGLNQDLIMAEIGARMGYDDDVTLRDNHIVKQMFSREQRVKERQKNIAQVTRDAARQRRLLVLVFATLFVVGVLAFLGSRTWFV